MKEKISFIHNTFTSLSTKESIGLRTQNYLLQIEEQLNNVSLASIIDSDVSNLYEGQRLYLDDLREQTLQGLFDLADKLINCNGISLIEVIRVRLTLASCIRNFDKTFPELALYKKNSVT